MSYEKEGQACIESAASTTPARSQEYLEERQLVETFARHVIEAFGSECVVVVCLPWTQEQTSPSSVVCPASDGGLDVDQLRRAARGKSICVVACTFAYTEEEAAARRIVDQLHQLGGMCVMCAHVVPSSMYEKRLHKEEVETIHRRILSTGFDDVFLNPAIDPATLRSRIRLAYHSWAVGRRKVAQRERRNCQVKMLESKNTELLWIDVPRACIPHFPVLNPKLEETESGVGKYKFVKQISSRYGTLWECVDEQHVRVAIKFVKKSDHLVPGDVEAVFREVAVLRFVAKHPHIIEALDFLHGRNNLYIILEHGGDVNLMKHLETLPGNRMDAADTLHYFRQIASAVAHCHHKMIAHRDIMADHVILSTERDGSRIAKLCDFRCATVVKPGSMSKHCCGQLPCMAPEMLAGRPYAPLPADRWSMGVLLLEMAGGVGTLLLATDVSDEEIKILDAPVHSNAAAVANKIQAYFAVAGSHEKALAFMGGVRDGRVTGLLKGLLGAVAERMPLESCALSQEETV